MAFKKTVNREALMKAVALVKPALAKRDYIKALKHIRFDGRTAMAYNDISAISVACDINFNCCLPGDLLSSVLSNYGTELVDVRDAEDGVEISSGRSKIKLSSLPLASFPFDMPDDELIGITVGPDMLKGINLCSINLGSDSKHPAEMGVTLDMDSNNKAVLFSTDNATISRYQTDETIKLKGDAVIIPRFFCEQLKSLAKAFGDDKIKLFIGSGYLLAEFGADAILFTKTIHDLRAMDFNRIFDRECCLDVLAKRIDDIPDGFEDALRRSIMVLDGAGVTAFNVGEGTVNLSTKSNRAVTDEDLKFNGVDLSEDTFYLDPQHVVRVSKHCSLIGFLSRVTVLTDADCKFVHLISHCQK